MDKIQKGYLLLLFLFSPILGLFKLLKLKNEKDITFFGTLFFGLVGSAFVYIKGTDGHSHLMNAKEYYLDMSLVEFFNKSYEILTFNSTEGSTDIYLHCISFISTSLLQTPELIHVFAGLVLGYFFTKSVLLILKNNLDFKKSYILVGFVILLLLIRSIGALNSIRMWTGMWVMFYGTYSWTTTKKRKYLLVILFSVLVHFSYALILIPAAAAYILQKNKKILVALYIVSFFSTVGFSFVKAYIPQSNLIEKKQNTYAVDSDEDAKRFEKKSINAKKESENLNFYKSSGETNYLNYSIVGLSIILIFFYFKKESDHNLNFLVAIGIGVYTFSNLVAFSPSLQGRTKMIAATFILAAAIHLQLTLIKYNLKVKSIKRLNTVLLIFLISSIPMFLFQLSDILYNISFFILLFPQVSWFLGDGDYSIRGVIGLLID
ncbi:hypothetical protein [Flavobacterium sp. Arc2]|uniref:hypothetical protein n=1 Tax=Flavobacterium sp. Arc2 TaxID=3046685 RepID=UPI00352C33B5